MKKRLKKAMALMLSMVLLICLTLAAGCGSQGSGGTNEEDLLTKIRNAGKMVVCTNVTEPWNYTDPETGEVTGMGVEIIEGFAEDMGVEVEYSTLEFASLIPAIEDGKADIIVTNLTRTVERATSKILYTDCVGSAQIVAVIQKGSYASIDEVDQKGVSLTTEAGTISEEIAPDVFKNAEMSACNTNADAIAALTSGRADAFITDTNVASSVVSSNKDLEYIDETVYLDTYAFGVKLDSSSYTFVEAFNTYLQLIKADGTYGELYEKYFGVAWLPDATDVSR